MGSSSGLRGRAPESRRIEALLTDARAGRGGALVVHGEAGIGKTALLRQAIAVADGMTVLTARGFESEGEIAYAGLADLLAPGFSLVDRLPERQAESVRAAMGLAEADARGDLLLCGGVLTLLGALAEQAPLLLAVDDLQWLDEASCRALVYVARRAHALRVAVLCSMRADRPPWADLPAMHLGGLSRSAGEALLADLGVRVAPAVAAALVDGTGGNPLALREVTQELSVHQLSGWEPLDQPLAPGASLTAVYGERLARLAQPTRTALLLVAASAGSSLAVLAPALAGLGRDVDDLAAAEDQGLIRINEESVRFSHPLVRSCLYHTATSADRRAAHRALAEMSLGSFPEDRRTWHLAAAVAGTDEHVAAALDELAVRARQRGDPAAAAAASLRAASLSPVAARRAERLLAAAVDSRLSGRWHAAGSLLEQALKSTRDPLLRHDIERERGRVLSWQGRVGESYELLVASAETIRQDDPVRAALAFAEAEVSASMAGRVSEAVAVARSAAALVGEGGDPPTRAWVKLALAHALVLAGCSDEARVLLQGEHAFLAAADPVLHQQPLALYATCQLWLGEQGDAKSLLNRVVDGARTTGSAGILAYALSARADLLWRTGRWVDGMTDAVEAVRLAEQQHLGSLGYALVCLARFEAAQGRQEPCRSHLAQLERGVDLEEVGSLAVYAGGVRGLLELGLDHHEEVVRHLMPVAARTLAGGVGEPAVVHWAPDLVEALVRCGRKEDAERGLNRLDREAARTSGIWAKAAAARCRGLLSQRDFEEPFADAHELFSQLGAPFDRARTLLCLGERRRRSRRPRQAREPLRGALTIFEQLGADPWTRRTRQELRAAGASVPHDEIDGLTARLTRQERRVAEAVASGMSNPEAASALFLSRKTVEFHLSSVYRKLRLRSRAELAGSLAVRYRE